MKHCIKRAYQIFMVRTYIKYVMAKLTIQQCLAKWLRAIFIGLILSPILIAVYAIGISRGIDVGVKHTLSQLKTDLIRGIKGKHNFYIQDVDGICFNPRGDGNVNYVQEKKECGE